MRRPSQSISVHPRRLVAALAAGAVLACAAAFHARPAVPGTADAAGEQLYREHCGSCHRLRSPGDHSQERWAWAVNRFSGRAHLAPGEARLVLDYLQARAKDAPPAPPAAPTTPPPPPAR